MIDSIKSAFASMDDAQQEVAKMTEKIFSASQPGAVYGEPVVSGTYTLITASEVAAGGGFGFGRGFGFGPAGQKGTTTGQAQSDSPEALGGGGGGGGAGGSMSRPVAVIVVGTDGVTVKPVVDATKIALAVITAWGAMAMVLVRMGRARKG